MSSIVPKGTCWRQSTLIQVKFKLHTSLGWCNLQRHHAIADQKYLQWTPMGLITDPSESPVKFTWKWSIIIFSDRDDYGAWGDIEEILRMQLPLRNITLWKANSRIMNLDLVNTAFLTQNSERFHFDNSPLNWYTRPFVNIFFIKQCNVIHIISRDNRDRNRTTSRKIWNQRFRNG